MVANKNILLPSAIMLNQAKTLEELEKQVISLNNEMFPNHNLATILGNGRREKPRFAFVFINPTHKNISSRKEWQGPRFPFIGTRQVWRVFYNAGLFDKALIDGINKNAEWSLGFTSKVLEFLDSKSFYFTNLVKFTGNNAELPDSAKIQMFLPLLKRELELLQPKFIVTFGLLPFESLTERKIKLQEYYTNALKRNELEFFEAKINSFKAKIIPCYFPVGRGNPKRAIEMLKMLQTLE